MKILPKMLNESIIIRSLNVTEKRKEAASVSEARPKDKQKKESAHRINDVERTADLKDGAGALETDSIRNNISYFSESQEKYERS